MDGKGVITLTMQKKIMINTSHEEQSANTALYFFLRFCCCTLSYWLLFFFLDIPQKEIPFFKKICFFFVVLSLTVKKYYTIKKNTLRSFALYAVSAE